MSSGSHKPSKTMGQNFLIDENIPRKIVRLSGIDKTCGVLEIGAGFGALTKRLAESAGHVAAIELDKRLIGTLQEMFAAEPNVTVIQGDILKADIRRLAEETLPELNRHVCANLPYNITTPAITRLTESGVFKSLTVMVQKEVAMRLCAQPGKPGYGALTVFVSYHSSPEMLFNVPPECFSPRPKVISSVVKMTMRPKPLLSETMEKRFFRTVKAAFGQRRKTLVNALYAEYGSTYSKEAISGKVAGCGFDTKIRGEMLSTEELIRISAAL